MNTQLNQHDMLWYSALSILQKFLLSVIRAVIHKKHCC